MISCPTFSRRLRDASVRSTQRLSPVERAVSAPGFATPRYRRADASTPGARGTVGTEGTHASSSNGTENLRGNRIWLSRYVRKKPACTIFETVDQNSFPSHTSPREEARENPCHPLRGHCALSAGGPVMLRKFLRKEVWLLALGAATLASPRAAAAQTGGTVSGRVVETSSQRPVADAQVSVVGTDRAAITN